MNMKGESESRCRHIAYSYRKALSRLLDLTSLSDGRITINNGIFLLNIVIGRRLGFNPD